MDVEMLQAMNKYCAILVLFLHLAYDGKHFCLITFKCCLGEFFPTVTSDVSVSQHNTNYLMRTCRV